MRERERVSEREREGFGKRERVSERERERVSNPPRVGRYFLNWVSLAPSSDFRFYL